MRKVLRFSGVVIGGWVMLLAGCAPPTPPAPWSLVVVSDSIAYNSPLHCSGCTGFVERYAAAATEATGHPVTVQNFSTLGIGVAGLLDQLETYESRRTALYLPPGSSVTTGENCDWSSRPRSETPSSSSR